MSKLRWRSAIAGLFLVGLSAFLAADRTRPVAAANELEIPGHWQWKLQRSPVLPTPSQCRVMVRYRKQPYREGAVGYSHAAPLTSREADEKLLVLDSLAAGVMAKGAVAIDLVDFRQFGDGFSGDDYPLRTKVLLKSQSTVSSAAFRLSGHSVRGQPVAHDGDWHDGEIDLLTLTTVSAEGYHTYTFFLTVRPIYD